VCVCMCRCVITPKNTNKGSRVCCCDKPICKTNFRWSEFRVGFQDKICFYNFTNYNIYFAQYI